MLDITKLWDMTYLFGPNPVAMSRSDFIFFYASLALIVVAVIFKIFVLKRLQGEPARNLLNRYFHLTLTMGALMLLWAGARWQSIPWLSAHVVVLVLWLGFFIWLGFILWYQMREHREQKRLWEEEQTKRQYLGDRK